MTATPDPRDPQQPESVESADTGEHVTRIEQRSLEATFSSPLPPPQYLDAYESTLPGAADRILTITESEVRHRQEVVSRLVAADVHRMVWLPRYILALAMAAMVFAVVALALGYPVVGTLIAVLDLGGVAASYLYGIWKNARSDDEP